MFYIGSHMGSLDDNYHGSSIRFKRAYKKRLLDFKRHIIYYHQINDHKSLLEKEQYWLDMIKFEELGIRYYNLKKSASGIDSKTATKINNERVKNGTHHYLGNNNPIHKRTIKGKNPLSGGEITRKRMKEGKLAWQQPGWVNPLSGNGDIQRKNNKDRLDNGTHNFLHSMNNGTHPSLIKLTCPHCNLTGMKSNMIRFHFDKCKKINYLLEED